MSSSPAGNANTAPLIVISGPSGVGKSTAIRRLLAETRLPLRLSVSATTRPPRPGEVDGVHYHFWTRAQFEAEIAAGGFLEHALVHGKHYYGTPKLEVDPYLAGGVGVLLDIDIQGADQVRKSHPAAYSIFLTAADYEKRLRDRKTEDEEAIRARLRSAELELARAGEYDIQLTNGDLAETVRLLEGAIAARFNHESGS